jgi:hypothetical protein
VPNSTDWRWAKALGDLVNIGPPGAVFLVTNLANKPIDCVSIDSHRTLLSARREIGSDRHYSSSVHKRITGKKMSIDCGAVWSTARMITLSIPLKKVDTEGYKRINIPCCARGARHERATLESDSRMWRAHPAWICHANVRAKFAYDVRHAARVHHANVARGARNKGCYLWTPL